MTNLDNPQDGEHEEDDTNEDSLSSFLDGTQIDMRRLADIIMSGHPEAVQHLLEVARGLHFGGNLDGAEQCVLKAMKLAEDRNSPPLVQCQCYQLLGEIEEARGNIAQAVDWIEKAYALADTTPLSTSMAWGLAVFMATLMKKIGQEEDSEMWFRRAERVWDAKKLN